MTVIKIYRLWPLADLEHMDLVNFCLYRARTYLSAGVMDAFIAATMGVGGYYPPPLTGEDNSPWLPLTTL